MVGIKDVAPDLLMPEGCLTRPMPDENAAADIARGREVLRALSPFDIGQAVGRDRRPCGRGRGHRGHRRPAGARGAAARARAAFAPRPARGVLVKAPKSGQDLRFDLPTIGPRTVEGAAAAGLAGIAVVAGNTLVAEPQAMIEAADAAGLFVTGLPA